MDSSPAKCYSLMYMYPGARTRDEFTYYEPDLSNKGSRNLNHPQETRKEMSESMADSYWLLLSRERGKLRVTKFKAAQSR